MYEMYPRVDEMKCDRSKLSNALMGQSQSTSDSRKLLQADSNGPQIGFVRTLPCLSLSCSKHPVQVIKMDTCTLAAFSCADVLAASFGNMHTLWANKHRVWLHTCEHH